MTSNIFQCLYAAGYYARSTRFDDIVKILLKTLLEVRMSSGPHLNNRRAALRPAGHGLDIPDLDLRWVMSVLLVLHLPRLVAMAAMFFICERRVSNLIYYFIVILLIFLFLLTTMVNNTKC